ncbi:MAG: glycosyltransferase family 4 protein [Anaerolineaceae bacterium]
MSKGSLLLIGNHLPTDKINKNVWHYLAEKLQSRGWGVITTSSATSKPLRLLDMAFTILFKKRRYSLAQIDVFSGKAFIFTQVCSFLLDNLDKPIVMTLHGGGLPDFARRYPKRFKRTLTRAAAVVSPSPYHQIELKKYQADIHLIPNPIDLATLTFRHRLMPTANLLWIRSFHEIYNPSMAPRVLQQLAPDFLDIQLSMIGPDKGDGSLQRMLTLAEELAVRDRIHIVGGLPHTEVPGWLSKGDIFINTTNFDTAPRSVIEAMASGLCIVSTDVGGIPYLVEHEQEGILVPPDDAPAMAAAIKRLLIEPNLGCKLSTNARIKAENYDWSQILTKWEALFDTMVIH